MKNFKLNKNIFQLAVLLMLMTIVVTLYLSPSKDLIADAVVLFVACLYLIRSKLRGYLVDLLFLIGALGVPVLFFLIYKKEIRLDYVLGGVEQLVMCAVVMSLFYSVFKSNLFVNKGYALMVLLLIPSLIHMYYLYLDMVGALYGWDLTRVDSAGRGVLEYLKETPRVGRRYASLAMVQLLFASIMIFLLQKSNFYKKVSIILFCMSVLSLLLLDARSAYVSLLLVFLIAAVAVPGLGKGVFCLLLRLSVKFKILLIISFLVITVVAFNTGKSRWSAMSYSFSTAYDDVFHYSQNFDIKSRPYVSTSFWDKPVEDPYKCTAAREFRCVVDQSAYLRSAWMLVGVKSMWEHPFGIGYSRDYMARLWGVDGQVGFYQRNDSTLVELVVCYGIFGLIFYLCLVMVVIFAIRRNLDDKSFAVIGILGILILSVLLRGIHDLISEGVWRYLMALIGIFFALFGMDAGGRRKINSLKTTYSNIK